jgi:TolB-like protein/Tfp pilus assembly protein PilF
LSFFEELKRRNVFRVGIAYGVVGWVVLQVADLVLDAIEAPGWVLKALMLLVGLGFVVALIVAWAYELTPEGLQREADVDRGQSILTDTGRKLDRIIIVFLAVAVAFLVSDRFLRPAAEDGSDSITPAEQAAAEKSIAVLPFRDMSPAGDQTYFAEGISEELLNALVKLGGLRVASRTSAFSLAGEGLDIPSIAQRLDVATILEGSVRTAGNRVRVTAQLIDVAQDVHLWSETYDGTLDDIFQIQDEITAKITDALKVQFEGDAPASTAEALTDNSEAYQLYLQGRHLWRQRNAPAILQAIRLFERAVELDPEFHQAWSNLAVAYANLPDYDRSVAYETMSAKSREAADRALALKPGYGEAMLIKASYGTFHCEPLQAARIFEEVIENNPHDPTAHHWHAILLDGAGRHKAALEQIREAHRIDPLISAVMGIEGNVLSHMGRYDESLDRFRQAAALGLYGGSRESEARTLMKSGKLVEAAQLLLEDVSKQDAERARETTMFVEAMLDPAKIPEFERFAGHEDPADPYQAYDRSDQLALLGSPYLFEYFSGSSCPRYGAEVWSEAFRELRGTQAFFDLMQRAGVVDYWREFGWPDDCASLDQKLAECPP